MRRDKDTQAYFSHRTILISVVIGVLLFAIVFSTCTATERSEGRSAMENALEFMRERCIQYDNMIASEEMSAQVQLLDKSKELARCLSEEHPGDLNAFLENYASDQRMTGIILLDGDGAVLQSVCTGTEESSLWDGLLEDSNVTDVLSYPQKYYMFRAAGEYATYDFVAVSLTNQAGYLLCYDACDDTVSDETQIAMENLFSGYRMEFDGRIIITDGDVILSSNDDELRGVNVEEYPLIASHRTEISAKDVDFVTQDNVRYMASSSKCKSYYLYVFFPTSAVYRQRLVIMAYLIVLYVLYMLVVISIRQREISRSDQLKMQFLRQMSHDIRTPINGIRGMVRIGNSFPDDPQKQQECRDKIWDASGYLMDLVSDVLDMGKLESGEIVLEDEPFDLREMIDGIAAVQEHAAKEHAVTFTLEKMEVEHWDVIGSEVHICRVINNLITNAVKYNRKDGTISLSCTETRRRTADGKIIYEFVCADTGIGMSREFQKHMFEQFSQENAAGELAHHGAGLGLAIVQSLVEKMGGTIRCKSKRGVGTTFYVELPLAIEEQEKTAVTGAETTVGEAAEANEPETLLEGIHVLLVEDNDLNMEIAEFILEDLGATVTQAWNGQEAVEKVEQSTPGTYQVILMDMMMPVMDGLTATKAIRSLKHDDASVIPIIAMTANVFEEDVNASRDAGMNAHLAKPIDEKKLRETILSLVAERNAL